MTLSVPVMHQDVTLPVPDDAEAPDRVHSEPDDSAEVSRMSLSSQRSVNNDDSDDDSASARQVQERRAKPTTMPDVVMESEDEEEHEEEEDDKEDDEEEDAADDEPVAARTRANRSAGGRKHTDPLRSKSSPAQDAVKKRRRTRDETDALENMKLLMHAVPKYLPSPVAAVQTTVPVTPHDWSGGMRLSVPEYGVFRGKLFTRKFHCDVAQFHI